MKYKIRNIYLVIKDQMPLKRFIKNFFITKNAWGLFHENSHIAFKSKQPKVMYNTKKTAEKSAKAMEKKHGVHFSNYKCLYCDGYHVGKTRENRAIKEALESNNAGVAQR